MSLSIISRLWRRMQKGNLLYIEAADMYLYDKGIDVGDKVIIQDNLLVKAGQE